MPGFTTPDSVTPPPMGQAPIPITTAAKSTATSTIGYLKIDLFFNNFY